MQQRQLRCIGVMVAAAMLVSSCRQASTTQPTNIPGTLDVSATETSQPPATPPTFTPTSTLEKPPTPTPAPRISVSENTHCRSGPAVEYPSLGVLQVGEVAVVVGRSSDPGYWYVTGGELPKDGCWLWGEFAQVEGEVEPLPVYTPAPSPTPQVGFDVFLKGFENCGSTFYAVFAVKNVGSVRFWSGYVEVQDFTSREMLHESKERHPFAATVLPVCPPDHGNELWPGETRYIHAEIPGDRSGSTAIGMITLCTADYQGGWCMTEYSYFTMP
jgi:hypothetical protein